MLADKHSKAFINFADILNQLVWN